MKKILSILILIAALKLEAATGDILSATIRSDGWSADIAIEGLSTNGTYAFGFNTNYNTVTATNKVVFTVTSQGFDTNGAATTRTRTVYGTKQVRKAYPNHASNDEALGTGVVTNRIALSDYIYAGDSNITVTIGSGFYTQAATPNNTTTGLTVTNNSTVTYPQAIGHFVVEQRRPVNGTHNIEVFAVQKFATQGKPLAKLEVYATGITSGNVERGSVTSMTLSERGDRLPVYSVPLDLSTSAGFTRGELVAINFTAWPWIGDSTSVLNSHTNADTAKHKLTPLYWTIMDPVYAVVDAASGNDSSGVASTSQAAADAAPVATISGALTKIAATNNTLYSLNRIDGSVVQLKAGNYQHGKYSSQISSNGYFTIKPHSSTDRAGVVFTNYVTSQSQYAYQRYYDVTFQRAANGFLVFAERTNVLVMERVAFLDGFTGWYSGDTATDLEVFDCITTNSYFTKGGNDGHTRIIRGTTYTNLAGSSTIIGGHASVFFGNSGFGSVPGDIWLPLASGEKNSVVAFNKWTALSDYFFIYTGSKVVTNLAVIGNAIERLGASAYPISEISDANNCNVLLWYNTYAGQRFNHENDIVSPYVNRTFTDYIGAYNVFNSRGDHRADIFDSDASMIGTWAVGYSVGWEGNWNEAGAYLGDTDFWGIYSSNPSVPIKNSIETTGGLDVG